MFAEVETIGLGWILTLLAGAGGVIAYLFRMLITVNKEKYDLLLAEKERQNKELEAAKNSMKEIAAEAVKSYLATANHYREKAGQPPIVPLVPVVSESHSPPTKEQREAAEIATMRAKMAQINLAMGIKPRQEDVSVGQDMPGWDAPDSIEGVSLATKADVVQLGQDIAEVPDKVAERLDETKDTK